jgi:sugar (pentulose or hexulose) kinase
MTDAQILAIDAGSQSTRAVLFNVTGQMTALAAAPAPDIERPAPGHAESRAEDFWLSVCLACTRLADEVPQLWREVAGIGLSAQRGTMLFVDAKGHATRPAILWSDARRCDRLDTLPLAIAAGTRLIGAHKKLQDLRAEAPANWIVQNEPDRWARTDKVVLLSAYLNFRLTGQWTDSDASQVGFLPFDFRQRRWYRAGHWRWRALGHLQPRQMPTLRPPGGLLGTLSPDSAAQLSLPARTPVFAAAADKACEVLGCGALDAGDTALSFGTAVTVNVAHPHFRHVSRFIPAFPAATTAGFLSESQLQRGLRVVPWFLHTMGTDGCANEADLEHFLATTSPGADGLTAELVANGTCADAQALVPGADGPLRTLLNSANPALVYRALIELLMLELRDEFDALTAAMALTPQHALAAGGGTRSAALRQIAADVLGLPLHCPENLEATALGAAMCAASGLAWYDAIPTAQAAMTPPATLTSPDCEAHTTYRAMARLALYSRS